MVRSVNFLLSDRRNRVQAQNGRFKVVACIIIDLRFDQCEIPFSALPIESLLSFFQTGRKGNANLFGLSRFTFTSTIKFPWNPPSDTLILLIKMCQSDQLPLLLYWLRTHIC